MNLYFSPLACSLATRIALYEAGADAAYVEVDPKTKETSDGSNFRAVNPLGLVPTLQMDDGAILTENGAILQHVADCFPESRLTPQDPAGRPRLHQWLSFIGTELHKALFIPLLDANAPEVVKEYALKKAQSRLEWVARALEGREFLVGEHFTVADAYLLTVLNWCTVTPVDLSPFPAIGAYLKRMHARPAVARAIIEEKKLYARELEGHTAQAGSRSAASAVILRSGKPDYNHRRRGAPHSDGSTGPSERLVYAPRLTSPHTYRCTKSVTKSRIAITRRLARKPRW